ncbi:MAG: hypothetical protein JJU00_13965 [Opitutales bacterium]|nr:hypothetical protein [Opitutales bacterium]
MVHEIEDGRLVVFIVRVKYRKEAYGHCTADQSMLRAVSHHYEFPTLPKMIQRRIPWILAVSLLSGCASHRDGGAGAVEAPK